MQAANVFARGSVIQVGVSSRARYDGSKKRSRLVQQIDQSRAEVAVADNEEHALVRGVVHGLILSLAIWTGVLYLTLSLL